jgi:hypothetical protein
MRQNGRPIGLISAAPFISFGEEMCVLSFVLNASWLLVNLKCAMRCPAAALCDIYFLVVGTLPDGDLNITPVHQV